MQTGDGTNYSDSSSVDSDVDYAGVDTEDDEIVSIDEDESSDEESVLSNNIRHCMTSRNNAIVWNSAPLIDRGRARAANIIRQLPGPPRCILNNCASPTDVFSQFITEDLLRSMVTYTNQEGRVCRPNDWQDTSCDEIRKFIGAVLLAGV